MYVYLDVDFIEFTATPSCAYDCSLEVSQAYETMKPPVKPIY